MEKRIGEIFKQLKSEIKNHKGTSREIQVWNLNYFNNHQSRYMSDFEMLMKYYNSGKILELGSAPFHFTYLMSEMGLPVTGVDIEPGRFRDFIRKLDSDVIKCNVETERLPF
ncbi:MAG: hypothetical protein DRP42_07520, partial [Tenericutes bacterium]